MSTAEGSAWLSDDGLRIYGAGWPQGQSSNALLTAERQDTASSFCPTTIVTELDSASAEPHPTMTSSELEIIFASDAPGGLGGTDLWIARRDDVALPFAAPTPITELNSPNNDVCPSIFRDGSTLVYNYDSDGVSDIWAASRTCLDP